MIPRGRICTRVTVPTGGWAWDIDISTGGGSLNTNLTGTIAAGDYFITGDNQSDDLMYALQNSIQTAIDAGPGGSSRNLIADIDPITHKVEIRFDGLAFNSPNEEVRLNLASWDADLCAALGFDTSNVTINGTNQPVFTADWHVGYNWYADEDSQTKDIRVVDTPMTFSLQSTSISGKVKTQFFGDKFTNELEFQSLERNEQGRTKVFSDGKGYGEAPVHPYNRNEPLECWWHEAKKGIEFRVYRSAQLDITKANDRGTGSVTTTTTLTDSAKAWSVEPFRWVGLLLHWPGYYENNDGGVGQSFYVSANTATQITVPNAHPSGLPLDVQGDPYYLFDHRYETYVLDVDGMSRFRPRERRQTDRYDISIPLKRYIA